MLIYHNGIYRFAITPKQKEMKKDYLVQQYIEGDHIPPFEEVWQQQQSLGDLDSVIEDYVGDYTRVDADDADVKEWLEEKGLLPEEPDYSSDEHDDWEELVEELIEEHREAVSEQLSEAKALEYIKRDIESLYDEAVYRIENELDGEDCWRTISLPVELDPITHQGLGIYWAYEESAAQAHWGGRGTKRKTTDVTYHGRIDAKYIDKYGTIIANTDHRIGEEEKEVRFHEGSPIYIYDVTVHGGHKWNRGTNEVFKIEDWRRC